MRKLNKLVNNTFTNIRFCSTINRAISHSVLSNLMFQATYVLIEMVYVLQVS